MLIPIWSNGELERGEPAHVVVASGEWDNGLNRRIPIFIFRFDEQERRDPCRPIGTQDDVFGYEEVLGDEGYAVIRSAHARTASEHRRDA